MIPSIERQWNTWSPDHPGAFVHLPTGFCLRLSAFSAKDGCYRDFHAGEISMLEHTSTGDYVRFRAEVADTQLEIEFAKPDPHNVVGEARFITLGEWGMRFWLALEIGFIDVRSGPATWRDEGSYVSLPELDADALYTEIASVIARYRSTWYAVVSDQRPVYMTIYDEIGQLGQDLEQQGYYAPRPTATRGGWAALRVNGQTHPSIRFAAGTGTDRVMALASARHHVAQVCQTLAHHRQAAAMPPEPWQAVRDVVAWNTIWDARHRRAQTVSSRLWLDDKFGGWGVWLDDTLLNALLAASVGDFETASANLDICLTTQAPAGNLLCLQNAFEDWVDRAQPPLAAYVVWRIFQLTGDRSLVTRYLPVLSASHDWWFARRGGSGGLLAYGSTPTGTGTFVHTKQGAIDESAMNNLPVFDAARFDDARHTLDLVEPGLNSLVSVEGQLIAKLAHVAGDFALEERTSKRAAELNGHVSAQLWDHRRRVFSGRLGSGAFVASLAPTCFFPLMAGSGTDEQVEELIKSMQDPETFWGNRVLPSSAFSDPASEDNVYWRGRIWPPLLFLVWEGLRRQRRFDLSSELSDRSWAMFADGWRTMRTCRENYHRNDPSGDAGPDSDPFYTWGALLPLMRMLEAAEVSPWLGMVFAPSVDEAAWLQEAGRLWIAVRDNDKLTVRSNGDVVASATGTRRLSIQMESTSISLGTAGGAETGAGVVVSLPWLAESDVRGVSSDRSALMSGVSDIGITVSIPADSSITIWMASECSPGGHKCTTKLPPRFGP